MITITAIFGKDAVNEYVRTNNIPSSDKEWKDGSIVLAKQFSSVDAYNAYREALEESEGTKGWRIISSNVSLSYKLQFKRVGECDWADFPNAPTIDDFNSDFPSVFLHNYSSNNYIAWEDDMFQFVDDEISLSEFKERGHDINTKWQAADEMKRLRQIIINETVEDFFSDLIAGKIEFRRIPAQPDNQAFIKTNGNSLVESINWQEYRKELIASLSNERLWALGAIDGHNPHLENIESIEEELSAIDSSDYETVISMHEDTPEYFDDYLINKQQK